MHILKIDRVGTDYNERIKQKLNRIKKKYLNKVVKESNIYYKVYYKMIYLYKKRVALTNIICSQHLIIG